VGTGPDTETEGSSLAFVAVEMTTPQPYYPPSWIRVFNASDFQFRSIQFFQVRRVVALSPWPMGRICSNPAAASAVFGVMQYGYWWIEVSWPYNTITDNGTCRGPLPAASPPPPCVASGQTRPVPL
jgi:hypothetical protein